MPNRYICAVLDEMRDCCKTGNYSYLPGLVEEAQSMANRMEAKLWEIKDWERMRKRYKNMKKKVNKSEDY